MFCISLILSHWPIPPPPHSWWSTFTERPEKETGDVKQTGDVRQTVDMRVMRQTGDIRQKGDMRQTKDARQET